MSCLRQPEREHFRPAPPATSFAEVLNRAAFGKERVVLTSRGKPLVAMVPIEDVEVLEQLEDQADAEQARGADGMAGRRLPLGFSGTRFSWSTVNRAMTYAVELGRSGRTGAWNDPALWVLCAASVLRKPCVAAIRRQLSGAT